MAEFTAAATLDVSVDDGQLRQVRREIERGIGDVEVGVSGGSTAGVGGRNGGNDLVDLARERNDILEDILNRGAGGGGGGGGGTNIIPIGGGGLLGGAASAVGTAIGGAASTALVAGAAPVGAAIATQFLIDAGVIPGPNESGSFSNQTRSERLAAAQRERLANLIPERGGPGDVNTQAILDRSRLAQQTREAGQGGGGRGPVNVNVELIINEAQREMTVQEVQQALKSPSVQRQIEQTLTSQVSNRQNLRTLNP